MKNILIPTDFSDNAWNAIKYAIHLYEQEHCKFHFLHTYTPIVYAQNFNINGAFMDAESLYTKRDTAYQTSENSLKATVKKIKKHHANKKHSYEIISAYNILTDEINTAIGERNIDLVILGKQGETAAKEILFGSNALYVMRKATCPVLAIPSTFRFKYIEDILFPTDFKHCYSKKDLSQVVEMTNLNEATVHLFHIANEPEFSEEQQENKDVINLYFRNTKHDFVEVEDAKISTAINTYILENNIGLLAMTHRKHSFLERLLFKQTLAIEVMHLTIPLLVLPVN